MKKYRTFSVDFKRQVVAEIDSGTVSVSQAARNHDLSPSLIDRWRKQIHAGTLLDRPSPREHQLEKELDRYKKKVAELLLEVDLLKKVRASSRPTSGSHGSVVSMPKVGSRSEGGAK